MEGIIAFGQAECRREDIPDRRNNQSREGSGNEPGRGVCEDTGLPVGVGRGTPWSVVKTRTEFGQGWSSTQTAGMGPAGYRNYCSSYLLSESGVGERLES